MKGKHSHIFDKDKDFFIKLWQTTRDNWKQNSLLSLGLICLFAALLLFLYGRQLVAAVFGVLGFAMWVIALWRVSRKVASKKVIIHDFNPISLGTVHFGFAITLWTVWASNPISDMRTFVIAIIVSLTSVAFFVATYNKPLRTLLNTQAAPYVIGLTFVALAFGSVFGIVGSLPAFPQTSLANRIIVQIIVYLGFAWIVTILLAMLRDIGNELARILLPAFLVFVAVTKLTHPDTVSIIGGIALMAIAVLAYLVITERLNPYGEVFEK